MPFDGAKRDHDPAIPYHFYNRVAVLCSFRTMIPPGASCSKAG